MISFVHVILDEVNLVVTIVGFWCNDSSEVAYDHAGPGSMLRWCNGSERAKFASRARRGGMSVLRPAGSATAAHDDGCHQRLISATRSARGLHWRPDQTEYCIAGTGRALSSCEPLFFWHVNGNYAIREPRSS